MKKSLKRLWENIYFEFYINIPLIKIQTRMWRWSPERMEYDICRLRIEIWKWSCEFNLYKRPIR